MKKMNDEMTIRNYDISKYDSIVSQIITNLVNCGICPLYELVFHNLHDSINLNNINISEVPSLNNLLNIQQKIASFVYSYVGTQSMICFHDLELELCQVLDTFNTSPLRQVHDDPNEIDLDEAPESKSTLFSKYGTILVLIEILIFFLQALVIYGTILVLETFFLINFQNKYLVQKY